jgi:hypothetical protein
MKAALAKAAEDAKWADTDPKVHNSFAKSLECCVRLARCFVRFSMRGEIECV